MIQDLGNMIRDLVDTIGVEPSHFDLLITAVIAVGGLWAIVRLFQDLTRSLDDDIAEIEGE